MRKVDVKYNTIIVDKKYINDSSLLRKKLLFEINSMIKKIDKYLNKYNKIVLYYDNGQEVLGKILDQAFIKFSGFEHRITFNHEEIRLFQLTDMLTY